VSASPLDRGISAHESHVDLVETQPLRVPAAPFDTAIKLLKQSLESDDSTAQEAGRYLLHSYYLKGTYAVESSDRKQSIFAEGKNYGEQLSERFPNNADIQLLYGANLGRWGEAYGIVSAAREGVAGTLREIGQRVVELDEEAGDAGGYRMLAQVNYKAPYIPFILNWPSTDNAIKHLEKALEIAPDHPGNNGLYGKYLYESGQKEKGLEYLRRASQMDPRKKPRLYLDDLRYITQAQEFLDKVSPQ
jgi:tetratricopeptide (TPR) repeat protein